MLDFLNAFWNDSNRFLVVSVCWGYIESYFNSVFLLQKQGAHSSLDNGIDICEVERETLETKPTAALLYNHGIVWH